VFISIAMQRIQGRGSPWRALVWAARRTPWRGRGGLPVMLREHGGLPTGHREHSVLPVLLGKRIIVTVMDGMEVVGDNRPP
jgi:hypothetical protein